MLPYEGYYYTMKDNFLNIKQSSDFEKKSHKQKSKDAAKKHAVAEQWRRWRINSHLQKLREILHPNMKSRRTVKASILTETVRQVKELKRRAADAGLRQDQDGWFCGAAAASPPWFLPGEIDVATVTPGEGNMVKATMCCEDRPGLHRDLTEAIRSSGSAAVRAEMATVGGRTKTEVVVMWPEGGGGEDDVASLRRGLRALVDNRVLGCNDLGLMLGVNGPSGLGLGLEMPGNSRVGWPFNCSNREWENLLSSSF